MLNIYFLGSFHLLYQGEPLKFATLPRTLPLWAYLLLHPQPITRDQLATTFWPEVEVGEARSNLRRHLHDLRRALPTAPSGGGPLGADDHPWLLSDHDTVQWNVNADAWFDVAA